MSDHAGPGSANSLIATTMAMSPVIAWIDEVRSQRLAGSGSLLGRTSAVAVSAATTMGTLIRNTAPHQNACNRTPPTIGPRAAPTIDTVPHTAMAMLRSRSTWKVTRISAKVAGIMVADRKSTRLNSSHVAISYAVF